MRNDKKAYPRYDDFMHIDSNAVARKAPASGVHAPRFDPDATSYTEMYCQPTSEAHDSIDENTQTQYYR